MTFDCQHNLIQGVPKKSPALPKEPLKTESPTYYHLKSSSAWISPHFECPSGKNFPLPFSHFSGERGQKRSTFFKSKIQKYFEGKSHRP